MKSLFLLSTLASVLLAQTPLSPQIPTQLIARAVVANLESQVPVPTQWKEKTSQVKIAWDFTRDCYSEMWTLAGVVDI